METNKLKKIRLHSEITAAIVLITMMLGISTVSFAEFDQPGVFTDETATGLPVDSNNSVRAGVGDVDGDSDLDVVVGPGSHTGPVLLAPQDFLLQINDGNGVFVNEAASRLPASAFGAQVASAVILGDVDGDSDLDIFVANGVSSFGVPRNDPILLNRLWINDGSGVFTDETSTRLPNSANFSFHAAFGDVDGDGDLDIVVGNITIIGSPHQNTLLINNGSGVFTDQTDQLPNVTDVTLAVVLADLDGDSDLDIVVANRQINGSKILINNGFGVFTDQSSIRFITPSFPFHGDVGIADVDGNGSPDIIFSSISGGPRVFINDGIGFFTDETIARTPTFLNSHGITLADVDLDGDVDIFVVVPGVLSRRLLLNDGAGFFIDATATNLPAKDPTIVDVVRYSACGDFDMDGDPDLYLPVHFNGSTSNQDRLLINQGSLVGLLKDLINTVTGLGLQPGAESPLLSTLNGALKILENDNLQEDQPAFRMLNGFMAIVEAKSGKQIDPSDADLLIDTAEEIIGRIGKVAVCIN